MIANSDATSSCGRPTDLFIKTGQPSTKKFHTPFGQMAQAIKAAQLQHQVRAPANTVDIFLGLQQNALLSINKFAKANYVTVFMLEEVNIFDGMQTRITSTHQPIVIGWRDPVTGLWKIPKKNEQKERSMKNTTPNNSNTNQTTEEVQQVNELPNTKQLIRYYHAAAGFPTKSTWLEAIKAWFYTRWLILTATAVMKHYPESYETQKGHMHQNKKGV